jgi:hypothetical protein
MLTGKRASSNLQNELGLGSGEYLTRRTPSKPDRRGVYAGDWITAQNERGSAIALGSWGEECAPTPENCAGTLLVCVVFPLRRPPSAAGGGTSPTRGEECAWNAPCEGWRNVID